MRQWEDCRTYVNYLLAEHKELDDELRGIQASLHEARAKDLLRRLTVLHIKLRQHFAEEDAGGCLEEAVSFCPNVARAADDLLCQHPALLANLEHVMGCLQSTNPADPERFRQELQQFTKELLVHEAAENYVMRRAFGTMMNGDGDDEDAADFEEKQYAAG